MSKIEGNYSRESYDKTQEDEANLKQQIGNAKSADEMIEIATKLKEIESNKQELHDAAYDEALAENQARMQRGELKESGSEKTMYEEAEDENKEFEKAKNINQLEETSKNLKEQLNQAKSADEMIEIAKQLKEIEEKKKEIEGGSQKEETGEKITTIEELKSKDSEDTTKKIEEIRKKINGGEEDKNKNEAQQENPFLKYAYHDQESYQKTMKQLHNDEMNQINELVGQIENGTISSLDKFKLKELMWRKQGGMKEEERNSIWEKIDGSSKKKNEVQQEKPMPSAEDIESAEKIFGKVLQGPMTSEQFEGSKIFLCQGPDSKLRYYAIRRNSKGSLEGNEFSLMEKTDGQWKNFISTGLHRIDNRDPNVTTGPTYQMHSSELEKMETLLRSYDIKI